MATTMRTKRGKTLIPMTLALLVTVENGPREETTGELEEMPTMPDLAGVMVVLAMWRTLQLRNRLSLVGCPGKVVGLVVEEE